MAASDALIVGEDWISEHYFTTDAKSESFQAKVTERRKAWDEDAKTVREDGDPESRVDTVRSRFLAARGSLGADLASLLADAPDVADAKLPDLYARLRTVLGYNTGEYTLKQVGPVIRVTTPDLNEAAPLVIVEARAADDRRGPHRQGRQDAADPVRGRRNDDLHVGGAAAVGAVRRGRRARVRPGASGPVAARHRAGPLGRGALPRRRPAARLRPERHQERRRDRPRPDLRERRVARAGRGGRHLVARRPRGLRQAHRGRVPGPARGRTAVDRDHRQRGGPAPQGPRARPAAARASAAARPAGAAVPVPDPVPALRGGVARA